jgi:hypothetical protein
MVALLVLVFWVTATVEAQGLKCTVDRTADATESKLLQFLFGYSCRVSMAIESSRLLRYLHLIFGGRLPEGSGVKCTDGPCDSGQHVIAFPDHNIETGEDNIAVAAEVFWLVRLDGWHPFSVDELNVVVGFFFQAEGPL